MSRAPVRLFALLLLAGAALPPHSDAAGLPVPTPLLKPPPPYFPTTPGAKWVYREGDAEETLAVTAVETKDGARVVTVSLVGAGGKSVPWAKVAVSEKGLYGVGDMHGDYDSPFCMLKLPSGPGDRWRVRADAAGGLRLTGRAVARGSEQVEVPAGRFTAVRVDTTHRTDTTETMRTTCWYAAGVGLVKMSYHPRREPAADDKVKVLKSFTPGED